MLVLGIDTSTKVGGVGLYDSEKGLIGETSLALEQTHSERLMPMLEHLLTASGITVHNLDGVAVAVGPGSFTGVRIGVTTAKTLAQVTGKAITGISTMEAAAYNLSTVHGFVVPIFDARNRRVYKARFLGDGRRLERLNMDGSCTIDELVDALAKGLFPLENEESTAEVSGVSELPIYFVGDAVTQYRELIVEKLGARAVFPPMSAWMPRGGVIAELGEGALQRGEAEDLYLLAPNYLKPAEAEVNWQKKHGK